MDPNRPHIDIKKPLLDLKTSKRVLYDYEETSYGPKKTFHGPEGVSYRPFGPFVDLKRYNMDLYRGLLLTLRDVIWTLTGLLDLKRPLVD